MLVDHFHVGYGSKHMKENIFVMSSNMQVGMWSSSQLSILYVAWINKLNSLHLDILEMCKDMQQTMKASNECWVGRTCHHKKPWRKYIQQSWVVTNMIMQIIFVPLEWNEFSSSGIERQSNYPPPQTLVSPNSCADHWCLFSMWNLSTLPCGWTSKWFKPTWPAHPNCTMCNLSHWNSGTSPAPNFSCIPTSIWHVC